MISIVFLKIGDSVESVSIQRKRGRTYTNRFYDNQVTISRLIRVFENATPDFQSEPSVYSFKIYNLPDTKGGA